MIGQNRRKVRVDREDEIALFRQMLNSEISERILLISAPSGIGKSELLREFRAFVENYTDVRHVIIDFKSGGVNLAELMFRICDSLDKSLFNAFSNIVEKEINASTINIQSNFMLGRNTIEVALNAIDDETSSLRRAALTDAFFADLRSLGKVLLVIDAFDLCTDPLAKAWIAGDFLHRICHTPNVIVVIAGQEIPQSTLEWENVCCEHTLRPIKREYWYEYAQKVGAVVPSHDSIDALYDYLNGHSLKMAEAFEQLYIPRETSR